eukprot:TRINITY_DN5133_c0_g1_i1.p1 TRINITY_DN5133_c0_g1~~TRINITY_DN5133_c0_g1_i1.p1  ORF type:complete len:271 (-),score=22.29 TRINITY_DN5133_c0_g1_i1:184-921(-)
MTASSKPLAIDPPNHSINALLLGLDIYVVPVMWIFCPSSKAFCSVLLSLACLERRQPGQRSCSSYFASLAHFPLATESDIHELFIIHAPSAIPYKTLSVRFGWSSPTTTCVASGQESPISNSSTTESPKRTALFANPSHQLRTSFLETDSLSTSLSDSSESSFFPFPFFFPFGSSLSPDSFPFPFPFFSFFSTSSSSDSPPELCALSSDSSSSSSSSFDFLVFFFPVSFLAAGFFGVFSFFAVKK